MSRVRFALTFVVASVGLFATQTPAQDEAQSAPAPSSGAALTRLQSLDPGLPARMAGLSPDSPRAYLLLGEEVAALARTDAEFELAETLFVLSFVLAGADAAPAGAHTGDGAGDVGVRGSACLALADLATSERRALWLRAIAGVVDPRYARRDWSNAIESDASPADRVRAAEALAAIRGGEGARARRILASPGVRRLFETNAGLLTGRGFSGILGEQECECK